MLVYNVLLTQFSVTKSKVNGQIEALFASQRIYKRSIPSSTDIHAIFVTIEGLLFSEVPTSVTIFITN